MNQGIFRIVNARNISVCFFAIAVGLTGLYLLQPLAVSANQFFGEVVLPILAGLSFALSFAASWCDRREKDKNQIWIGLLVFLAILFLLAIVLPGLG